jgi:hypothetical protein
MAPRPTAERPPKGLNSYWTHVWNHALKVMQEQDTWAWELKPLLDEYVFALRAAENARDGFAWLDHLHDAVAREEVDFISLRAIATGLPTQWDRHTKRAAALADALLLTPTARRRHGLSDEAAPDKPTSVIDELAARRPA